MRLKLTKTDVREQRVIKIVADAPRKSAKIMQDAFAGTASPRRAINAMCLACTSYNRAVITACTGYSCPLWKFRPYQQEK